MNTFNLSDQALGAVMMALQKSLMEQSDIVPTLKGMNFVPTEEGLVVSNPPLVKFQSDGMALFDDDEQAFVDDTTNE
tara:strand:- start:102 stop:332 length:231 start_codon:yes stop_codon:yes gene_type:complete